MLSSNVTIWLFCQAFKAVKSYLERLEKLSENPDLLQDMGELMKTFVFLWNVCLLVFSQLDMIIMLWIYVYKKVVSVWYHFKLAIQYI